MECNLVRSLLLRKIDGELQDSEDTKVKEHLAKCPSCTREYRILLLPNTIGTLVTAPTPSAYFYQKVKAQIESEVGEAAAWQMFLRLSRKIVPVFASLTIALLSIFAYLQLRSPEVEIYKAYERVFAVEDPTYQLLVAGNENITNEEVLRAIAARGDYEWDSKSR